MSLPHALYGIRLLPNVVLTTTETVPRTWRERLWSWPWRPWRTTKQVVKPDPNVYITEFPAGFGGAEKVIFGHPETLRSLAEAFEAEGESAFESYLWAGAQQETSSRRRRST